MAALTLVNFWRKLGWQARRLACQPWAGAALMVLALAAVVASVHWWRSAGEWLEVEQVARQKLKPEVAKSAGAAVGTALEIQRFLDSLPFAGDEPVAVQKLLDLAAQQNLRMQRGSYQWQTEPAARFSRYRMNLPVRGDPVGVQRFIYDSMLAMPSLTLESVQFKRAGDTGQLLEARIQWVLFVRAGGGTASQPPPEIGMPPVKVGS